MTLAKQGRSRLRAACGGRPATIDATKIRAEGLGASEIAKQLNIGRATSTV